MQVIPDQITLNSNSMGTEIQIFEDFLEKLGQFVDFETGSLFLYDVESNALKEIIHKGDGIDFIGSVRFQMGKGLSAWVAQKGRSIYLPDIHRGSRHGQNPVRSYLSIPVEVNDRICAVLNLGHGVPNAFGEDTIKKITYWSREIIRKIYNRNYKIN